MGSFQSKPAANAKARAEPAGLETRTSDEYLRVRGDKITLREEEVILKGAAIGGWMNMENFITGYTGHEHQLRAAMKDALGEEKYEFFFDKFLQYFFQEEDAKFFASLGLNCIRIPVNYHHFEDDMNPRVFKKEGLKHLDRVVDICAKHGIYTVIDLHAAPGGQNFDWHSDNATHKALFYDHKDFQDRTILIWEHLARHYKNNTWVAGYNPLNEPTDEKHVRLISFYERVEKAIRAIDPNHILFLDTFASDFSHFDKPLPNSVYTCHDYSDYGFPNPPEPYTGSKEQVALHQRSFEDKTAYMRKHKGPIWVGEWGPVYQNTNDGIPDWEKINDTRFEVLKLQLGIFGDAGASWSIWLYKDIGFQGMVYAAEDTAYVKLLKDFLRKKRSLAADKWGADDTPVRALFTPLEQWLESACPSFKNRYPAPTAGGVNSSWKIGNHVSRLMRNILLSEELVLEFASVFKGKSYAELDELAKSFEFAQCVQRERLNQILKADSKRTDHVDEKVQARSSGQQVWNWSEKTIV
ncbi:endoglucanase C [Kwoniella heveanensis CBS 569]|nr:endoglucanase C [Kwoniella heveanensis CBS 569]